MFGDKAKKYFEERKAKGDTVAYSEVNEKTKDIMKIALGNIEPKAEMVIRFEYTEQLEVSIGKFWKHMIFSTITPRYDGSFTNYFE